MRWGVAALAIGCGGGVADTGDAPDTADTGEVAETGDTQDGDSVADSEEVCTLTDPTPLDVTPEGRVRPIYLAAPDTSGTDVVARREVFEKAVTAMQIWYGDAMGPAYAGASFRAEPVLVMSSRYTRAEWTDFGANGFLYENGDRSDGCGLYHAAWDELVTRGRLASAGLPPVGDGLTVYLVVAGGGWGGGCGGGRLGVVEELELDRIDARCPNDTYDACTVPCSDPEGLGDVDPWCDEAIHQQPGYECTAVGAFAHELGHGFGLPHGAERPTSTGATVMDLWWEYGHDVTLSVEDRADLAASPFFD